MFCHRGALQHHARSLKVVTNLHEKEQTGVILTFNEEVQPAVTASSATPALQSVMPPLPLESRQEGGW